MDKERALTDLLLDSPDGGSDDLRHKVLDELERKDLPTEWRDVLVRACDELTFSDASQQQRLLHSLLRLIRAAAGRLPPDAPAEEWDIVRAMLRRASFVLPTSEITELAPFLTLNFPPAVVQAALEAVRLAAENRPPSSPAQAQPVLHNVKELVEGLLSGDVSGAEQFALLVVAVTTLAALGDSEVRVLAGRAKAALEATGHPHRVAQLQQEFRRILKRWQGGNSANAGIPSEHPARQHLEEVLTAFPGATAP